MANQGTKKEMRQEIKIRLSQLDGVFRDQASQQACARLLRQTVFERSQHILAYAAMAGELNLWPVLERILQAGKTLCLPRYLPGSDSYEAAMIRDLEKDLRPGKMGIREPSPNCPGMDLKRLDLILVPGVAFDRCGRRLGRGKGYYDRILSAVEGFKCGVCFDQQLVDQVPVESHDELLDCILTPAFWLIAGRGTVLE